MDAESWYAYHTHPGRGPGGTSSTPPTSSTKSCLDASGKTATRSPIITGASFGAFHALSMGLRYPDRVNRVLRMSGLTDIKMFLGGYHNETVYFQNPVEFIPNEHDGWRLDQLRQQDIILVGRQRRPAARTRTASSPASCGARASAMRCASGMASPTIGRCGTRWCNMYIGGHDVASARRTD